MTRVNQKWRELVYTSSDYQEMLSWIAMTHYTELDPKKIDQYFQTNDALRKVYSERQAAEKIKRAERISASEAHETLTAPAKPITSDKTRHIFERCTALNLALEMTDRAVLSINLARFRRDVLKGHLDFVQTLTLSTELMQSSRDFRRMALERLPSLTELRFDVDNRNTNHGTDYGYFGPMRQITTLVITVVVSQPRQDVQQTSVAEFFLLCSVMRSMQNLRVVRLHSTQINSRLLEVLVSSPHPSRLEDIEISFGEQMRQIEGPLTLGNLKHHPFCR